jgi:hypothetical protein
MNKNDTTLEVFVHRKPVAETSFYFISVTEPQYATIKIKDTGSYDPDFLNAAQKGIVEREFSIKEKFATEWDTKTTTNLAPIYKRIKKFVPYTYSYRVKDKHGAWSDEEIIEIMYDGNIIFNAKMKSRKRI